MIRQTKLVTASLIVIFFNSSALALEDVRLQLRWYHQFQFAGYYMAKEKGFYQEEGLNVHIQQATPGRTNVIESVTQGDADFGVSNSSVIVEYFEGQPVIALAAINQTSPLVWITLKSSNIRIVQDLPGHTLMTLPEPAHSELLALLHQEGIPFESINIVPSSFDINDLISGKVDAFYGYISNEPYALKQLGIQYHLIKPREYGINFYSDVLFTHQKLAKMQPEKVERFLRASLKGWEFAMDNIDESVNIIHSKYAPNKSIDHLKYEANALSKTIMHELVQIGHMNPGRWDFIAKTYQYLGVTKANKPLENFLFSPKTHNNYQLIFITIIISGSLLLLAGYIIFRFKRLSVALQKSNAELASIAISDPLTGVMNRRGFIDNADRLISLSQREGKPICFMILDIDHFKNINDQFGHKIGDFCLIEFCEIIQSCCRLHDLVARVGGEEFVILLGNCSADLAEEKAQYLLKRIQEHSFKPNGLDHSINLTVSIGIAEFSQSLQHTWQCADEALYSVKNSGRNNLKVYMAKSNS